MTANISSNTLPSTRDPIAWHRSDRFVFHFSLGPKRPPNNTSDPDEWVPLYGEEPAIWKVKDLVWEVFGEGYRSLGPLKYDIYPTDEGGWHVSLSMAGYMSYSSRVLTLEEAKKAAQLDLVTRVFSSFDVLPPQVSIRCM